jgi:hypothetical protein
MPFSCSFCFYWVECWGVVGPPKRNCRERGMVEVQHLPK